MDAFCELVKDLVINQNVKQSELYKKIRETLKKEAEKLPKVKVAYNACYGGYGYSEAFEDYLHEICDMYDKDHRMAVIPMISSFGELMAKEHPDIARAIGQYMYHDVGTVFTNINTINHSANEIGVLKINRELTKSLIDEDFGTCDNPSRYDVVCKKIKDSKFTRSSLLQAIDDAITYYEDRIFQAKEDVNYVPEETLKTMMNYYLLNKNKSFRKENLYDKTCFYDAVNEKDEKIWECQDYFDATAMNFLMEHPEIFEDSPVQEVEQIGLLFATGPYSFIKIKEVPQIVEWEVCEYDGNETIKLI